MGYRLRYRYIIFKLVGPFKAEILQLIFIIESLIFVTYSLTIDKFQSVFVTVQPNNIMKLLYKFLSKMANVLGISYQSLTVI